MKVVVLGGGVIGAACAYYLSQRGCEVAIVERGQFGKGCSHANCGIVCPSHVLPLAEPGAIGRALKSMLQKNAPFYIKPRVDLALWSWLWRFMRCCNAEAMLSSGRAIQALLNSSRTLYDELMRTEPFDCEWETRGLLFVFVHAAAMEHYAQTVRLQQETFNLAVDRYDGDAVAQLQPALKPGLAGAFHYRTDAHLRPDRLMSSWKRVLEGRGVRIHENREATGLAGSGKAHAVRTSRGDMPADAVVVATGAWTPFLNRHLGCKIPIQPGKGYSITMPRPARCPTLPMIFEEHRVAVTPMQSGYRLGSTMEFAGYDTTLNRSRLTLLKEGASHYLHEPYCEPVVEEWYGWRPMTPDSVPIIDRSPAFSNVYIAAGHNMLGVSMSPATGKLVAEMLTGERTHIDPEAYRVSRY